MRGFAKYPSFQAYALKLLKASMECEGLKERGMSANGESAVLSQGKALSRNCSGTVPVGYAPKGQNVKGKRRE